MFLCLLDMHTLYNRKAAREINHKHSINKHTLNSIEKNRTTIRNPLQQNVKKLSETYRYSPNGSNLSLRQNASSV